LIYIGIFLKAPYTAGLFSF